MEIKKNTPKILKKTTPTSNSNHGNNPHSLTLTLMTSPTRSISTTPPHTQHAPFFLSSFFRETTWDTPKTPKPTIAHKTNEIVAMWNRSSRFFSKKNFEIIMKLLTAVVLVVVMVTVFFIIFLVVRILNFYFRRELVPVTTITTWRVEKSRSPWWVFFIGFYREKLGMNRLKLGRIDYKMGRKDY